MRLLATRLPDQGADALEGGGSRQVLAIAHELGTREMHYSTASTRHTGVTCSESAHRLCETEHVRVTHARHWRSSLLEHNSSPSSARLQSASIERDRENAACGSNPAVARSCRSLEMIGGRLRASTVPTQFRQASSPHKSSKNQPAWRYSSGELCLPHRRKKDTKSEHWLTLLTVRPPNRPLATPRGYRSRDNAQARRRGASVRCPDPSATLDSGLERVARFDQRMLTP